MKVKRCYLRLVSCFVLGFCLIFSSTLHVNAAAQTNTLNYSQTFNVTLYPSSSTVSVESGSFDFPNSSYTISISEPQHTETGSGRYTESQTGYISTYSTTIPSYTVSGTITNSNSSSSSTDIRLDCIEGMRYYSSPLSWEFTPFIFNSDWFDSNYKYVGYYAWNLDVSSSIGSLNNVSVSSFGQSLTNQKYINKQTIRLDYNNQPYYVPTIKLACDFNYAQQVNTSRAELVEPINFTVTISFRIRMADTPDSTVADNSTFTNDITNNQLQEQNNTITQDTNTVTHDTNNKVTSFFGAFWDNLLHIFVPESGFFQQWFSDLNSFMSQKLGFLWSPFDFVISFLNGIYSSSGGSSPGIVFPGLTWIDGTVIIPQQTFSFDNIGGESFSDLRDMIYFATDVILLGAVVHQFYQKIKILFEGGSD